MVANLDASTVFNIILDLAQSIRLRARPNLLLGPQANSVIFPELCNVLVANLLPIGQGSTQAEGGGPYQLG